MDTAFAEQLGLELRRERRRKHLRMEDVRERTGITTSDLSRFETGQRVPKIERLLVLAQLYEVPASELIDRAAVASVVRDTPPYLTSPQAA